MKALAIECSSFEWWGASWRSPMPYSFDFRTLPDAHGLPNAPLTVHALVSDPLEAAQLLRLLAAHIEQHPQLFAPLNEPDSPAPDDSGVPF